MFRSILLCTCLDNVGDDDKDDVGVRKVEGSEQKKDVSCIVLLKQKSKQEKKWVWSSKE